jgi:hypothetical protein
MQVKQDAQARELAAANATALASVFPPPASIANKPDLAPMVTTKPVPQQPAPIDSQQARPGADGDDQAGAAAASAHRA